ncbi:MAG TPA: ABC transporter substrate-binding protein [Puia sp.]
MKKVHSFLFAPALLVCLLFTGDSCNQPESGGKNKITFGVSPFPDTEMPLLGKIKGWYAEEGLDVDFRILGWTEVQEALSSNSANRIDVGINNISSVIATHNKNPDLIYYYGFNTFDNGFALMVRPNGKLKPLQSFLDQGQAYDTAVKNCSAQLKGATVITTASTDMEQGVAACARKGGLDIVKDVKIINLNPDEGLASFISGTGDAYIGGIPQRTKAAQEGMIAMVTGTDLGPAPINGLVTTKKFLAANPEALSKLLKVWFRIVQYTNAHLDEVSGIMVKELNKNTAAGVSPDQFRLFWNNYEHYPSTPDSIQAQILDPTGKNYWKKRWDDCNFYFFNITKTIPAPVEPKDAFFMVEAQQQLKDYLTKKP